MSATTDMGKALSDAYNGKSSMWGNAASAAAGLAGKIPGLDAFAPTPEEAKAAVNNWTGADQASPDEQGNLGNKIGTVAGSALGWIGGPTGSVAGGMLGSAAGGWLANAISPGDGQTGPITVPPPTDPKYYPTEMVPEEP